MNPFQNILKAPVVHLEVLWVTYLVEVFQGEYHFSDVDPYFVLREAVPLVEMREQFPSTDKVWNTGYTQVSSVRIRGSRRRNMGDRRGGRKGRRENGKGEKIKKQTKRKNAKYGQLQQEQIRNSLQKKKIYYRNAKSQKSMKICRQRIVRPSNY